MPRPSRQGPLAGGRAAILALAAATAVVVAAGVAGTGFLWNLSPSLPRGLYRRDTETTPWRGAVVTFEPPPTVVTIVAERAYLPPGASLLKTVVALAGDRVCIGDAFSVEDALIGPVLTRDTSGRPLEPYRFCGTVPRGYAFVATRSPHSFDSRYFGPVPLDSLIPVRPVWTF